MIKTYTPLPIQLGCSCWYDAADTRTITSSSGSVSAWQDKSGGGNNATQATGADQPQTGSVTLNGLNTLTFNGTSSFMTIPTQALFNAPFTVFVVLINTQATREGVLSRTNSTQSGGYSLICSNTGAKVSVYNPTTFTTTTAVSSTNMIIATEVVNSSPLTMYVNGSTTSSNTISGYISNPGFTCSIGVETTFSNYYPGSIGEVIFFPSSLATGQFNQILSYLSLKWGIAL